MDMSDLFPAIDQIVDDLNKEIENEKKNIQNDAISYEEIEKEKNIEGNLYGGPQKKNICDPIKSNQTQIPTFGGTKKKPKSVPYKHGILNGSGPGTINGYGIRMSDGRIS